MVNRPGGSSARQLELHTDLTSVRIVAPELADRLDGVRAQLESMDPLRDLLYAMQHPPVAGTPAHLPDGHDLGQEIRNLTRPCSFGDGWAAARCVPPQAEQVRRPPGQCPLNNLPHRVHSDYASIRR